MALGPFVCFELPARPLIPLSSPPPNSGLLDFGRKEFTGLYANDGTRDGAT
jgi:hypothetical protein